MKWALDKKLIASEVEFKYLCKDREVVKAVIKELDTAADSNKFKGFEKIKAVYLEEKIF
jgi:hypothetical protein